MIQGPLLQESIEKALEAVLIGVYGRGYWKKAAHAMFPTEDCEKKGDWLRRALDDADKDRREKIGPNDVMWIIRKGREHGIHTAMYFIADDANYTRPTTIEPEDERAALQREFIDAVSRLEAIKRGLEK